MRPSPEWVIILGRPRSDAGHCRGTTYIPLLLKLSLITAVFFPLLNRFICIVPLIPMENKAVFHRSSFSPRCTFTARLILFGCLFNLLYLYREGSTSTHLPPSGCVCLGDLFLIFFFVDQVVIPAARNNNPLPPFCLIACVRMTWLYRDTTRRGNSIDRAQDWGFIWALYWIWEQGKRGSLTGRVPSWSGVWLVFGSFVCDFLCF